jgi:predicted RNA-binding Zn-ribbon protein involved in translation (DUF1610 family)
MVKGYCVKCRKKDVEMVSPKVVSKHGRKMTQGKCPKCGTKMTRFGG